MSIFLAPTPTALAEVLSGELTVVVDDVDYAATAAALKQGLTGPTVVMQAGAIKHCTCDGFAEIRACWHACDLRALVTHTARQMRLANVWVDAKTSKPYPANIRHALGVAERLSGTNPHVWPGMLPDGVRPGSPGFGGEWA